jgi:hypothetical protein
VAVDWRATATYARAVNGGNRNGGVARLLACDARGVESRRRRWRQRSDDWCMYAAELTAWFGGVCGVGGRANVLPCAVALVLHHVASWLVYIARHNSITCSLLLAPFVT